MTKRIAVTCATLVALAAAGPVGLSARQGARQKAPAAAAGAVKAAAPAPSRVDSLVASMTLDEKVSMLYGVSDPNSHGQAGYIPGVPRLGIPPLRLTDGPAGVRVTLPATALPAPVALASTFSPTLARQYGQIIGRDARARHQNVVLAPMVNIVRVPQAGRNFETLGEDPLLAARLVAAEIEGMQSQGTIATVKHYAFNNQENQRMSVSAEVEEQAGREIELFGFEAAIRAGVGSVMAAYNKVNGAWAAESAPLLTDVLRQEWGFKGFVMSDWFATHSAAPALSAGMEMEMPNGRFYGSLAPLVKKGQLKEGVVDEAVRRVLTAMDAAGLLKADDRPVPEIPESDPGARDIAIAGAVLLKNQGGALPLSAGDLGSVAVIGPTAKVLLVGGGGSASVKPMHGGSPIEALQKAAGAGSRFAYASGYDLDGEQVPASVLRPQATIDFVGKNALPPGSTYGWSGSIVAPKTGDYVMKLQTSGGRATLSFGPQPMMGPRGQAGGPLGPGAGAAPAGPAAAPRPGAGAAAAPPGPGAGPAVVPAQPAGPPMGPGQPPGGPGGVTPGQGGGRATMPGVVLPGAAGGPSFPGSMPAGQEIPIDIPGFGAASLLPTADGLSNASTPIHLEAGVATPFVINVSAGRAAAPIQVRLSWVTPDLERARIEEAVAAAKAAKVAVVFAHDEGTEGRDRASLSLPGNQDALIAAVAAANPKTVVVLSNGAPVLMPWADKVAAILQMWYPGQEGAAAAASILLGQAVPGGRLPVTFPVRAEDAPTAKPERYPGVDGKGTYSEGILVGYRWYDAQKIEPLFPFGHGLSYTTFAYSGLGVRRAGAGYDVTFTVKNTGAREGVDVPQVYVGPPANPAAPMAVKKLVGFDRITLAPGASKKVTIRVDRVGLSYWSAKDHKWTVAGGKRTFMVGASSRDIKLRSDVNVTATM